MNKILVVSLNKKFKKFEEEIHNNVLNILKALNKTNILAEIYLIDDKEMKFLNKKFRDENKTATVLSFKEPKNFIMPLSKHKKIGEIYLNARTFTDRARTNMGNSLRESAQNSYEFALSKRQSVYLLIHSILHLFGYDHQKKNDRIKMNKIEQKLFYQVQNIKM